MGKAPTADEPTSPMTREETRAWAEQQRTGRFERMNGIVVAMAPERVGHNRRKRRAYEELGPGCACGGAVVRGPYRRNHG
jgi:Uma2 family endonuclease